MEDALYVPKLHKNLLLEDAITIKGIKIGKQNKLSNIYYNNGELAASAQRMPNNMYHMLFKTVIASEVNITTKDNVRNWHERVGHINLKSLQELSNRGLIEKINIQNEDKFFCEGCQMGKQHKLSISERNYKSTNNGDLIYSDLCGLFGRIKLFYLV